MDSEEVNRPSAAVSLVYGRVLLGWFVLTAGFLFPEYIPGLPNEGISYSAVVFTLLLLGLLLLANKQKAIGLALLLVVPIWILDIIGSLLNEIQSDLLWMAAIVAAVIPGLVGLRLLVPTLRAFVGWVILYLPVLVVILALLVFLANPCNPDGDCY